MTTKEIFLNREFLCSNLTPFASNLSYFYLCRSNLDPDPQHWLKDVYLIGVVLTGMLLQQVQRFRAAQAR